jgi:Cu/Ag efflux protein CusF
MTGAAFPAHHKETPMRLIPLALAAALAALPAAAQMNHGDMPMKPGEAPMDHGSMPMNHGDMPMNHGAASASVTADATVNAVSDTVVNVTHGPIPAIGWPPMTMDMPLLEGADTGGAQPGDTVVMTLEKGADGMYGVKALAPK